jgi:hypothetical protein
VNNLGSRWSEISCGVRLFFWHVLSNSEVIGTTSAAGVPEQIGNHLHAIDVAKGPPTILKEEAIHSTPLIEGILRAKSLPACLIGRDAGGDHAAVQQECLN